MKRTLLIVVALLLCAAGRSQDASPADEAYRQGDYETAIEAYEALIGQGYISAELHYNLGNAYYRDGQTARAILNYERALRLRPSMRDASENLALAQSHTQDRISELPRFAAVRWWQSMTRRTSPTLWRVMWLLLFALLLGSLLLFRLGGSVGSRKAGFAALIACAMLLAADTAVLLTATRFRLSHPEAIVMQPVASVKNSPERQGTDKLLLHEGTKVEIEESQDQWFKIRIADGTTGWCEASNLERI